MWTRRSFLATLLGTLSTATGGKEREREEAKGGRPSPFYGLVEAVEGGGLWVAGRYVEAAGGLWPTWPRAWRCGWRGEGSGWWSPGSGPTSKGLVPSWGLPGTGCGSGGRKGGHGRSLGERRGKGCWWPALLKESGRAFLPLYPKPPAQEGLVAVGAEEGSVGPGGFPGGVTLVHPPLAAPHPWQRGQKWVLLPATLRLSTGWPHRGQGRPVRP